jgi:uncharacterized protein YwqG
MTSFLQRLLGKKSESAPPRDVAALVAPWMVPAVQVEKIEAPSYSHFGGVPNLPSGVQWPEHEGRQLEFLARLSLGEIQEKCSIDWLPPTGSLLFFYDMVNQPWGYDPKSRGSVAVLHVPDLPHKDLPKEYDSDGRPSSLPHVNIGFRQIAVAPNWDHPAIRALDLSVEEADILSEIEEAAFGSKPRHQIIGYASPIQGDDMDLECQLVTNGLYCGDSSGYNDPRAASLAPAAKNWKLLFQFDSDDDLDIMWGDCGMVYFWVEEQRAAVGDFSNAWLILQCS